MVVAVPFCRTPQPPMNVSVPSTVCTDKRGPVY